MPYGIPLSQTERTLRHQSIYGEEPPVARQLQCSTTTVGIAENEKNLLMIAGGAVAIYVFVDFILPNIWK